jgi:hypothetical protein
LGLLLVESSHTAAQTVTDPVFQPTLRPGLFARPAGPVFAQIRLPPPGTPAQTRFKAFPTWLEVHAEQRTRFESADHRYRPGEIGGDEMIAFRTRAQVRVTTDHLFGIAEVQDSRVGMTDSASTITSRAVFNTQMAQLSAGVRWRDLGRAKLALQVEVGRFSRDYGTGRLISRLIYANTTYIQDGVVAGLRSKNWTVQGLALRPVTYTYPNIERDPRFDRARFGGVYATSTRQPKASFDLYFLHLNDGSTSPAATRRRLETPGVRVFGAFGPSNRIEYEAESATQWGQVGVLTHRAWFEHVQAGYAWPTVKFRPRLLGLFDYATGDADPTDQRSGAFDTLYGRVRFEFGPTSFYGLAGRSNLRSPGVWLILRPSQSTELSVQQRWLTLANARDRWRPIGVGDPTGAAGSDLGRQLEVRFRYRWRQFVDFDGGMAHFTEGDFVRAVRPMPGGHTTFYYAGTEWRF